MAFSKECINGVEEFDFSFPLRYPKPLQLCEEGNFEELFTLYYDETTKDEYQFTRRNSFSGTIKGKSKIHKLHRRKSQGDITSYTLPDFENYQPIHYAAAHGNLRAVRKLVEQYKCASTATLTLALCIGCFYGHLKVVEYFVLDCNCYTAEIEDRIFNSLNDPVLVALNTKDPYRHKEPMFKLKGKEGHEHVAIVMFLLKHEQVKNHNISASLPWVMLKGTNDDLEIFENLLPSSINYEKAMYYAHVEFTYVGFVFWGNNLPMMEHLLLRQIVISDAILIEKAWQARASNDMLYLIISKCPSNPMYNTSQIWDHKSLIDIVFEQWGCFDFKFVLDCFLKFFGSSTDSTGRNILHYGYPSPELTKYVVQQKPHLQRQPDSNLQLPVHTACSIDASLYRDLTEYVDEVSRDCNIDACDINGSTPLHLACQKWNWEIIDFLIYKRGASVTLKNNKGCTPLHFIIGRMDFRVPKHYDINEVGDNGNTLLHIACLREKTKLIKYLVCDRGALVHIQNSDGETPLHIVLKWLKRHLDDAEEVIELLSDERAIALPDNEGQTPLHIACSYMDRGILAKGLAEQLALTSSSAKFNKAKLLPVHILLRFYYWGRSITDDDILLSKLLLENVDVNLPDSDGNTPLHLACNSACKELILYLLGRGAMTQIQNKNGQLPLSILLYAGCRDMWLVSLISTFQTMCTQDCDGVTPLHIVCLNYRSSKIDYEMLLLKVGLFQPWFSYYTIREDAVICLNLKDRNGFTPLHHLINNKVQAPLELMAMFCSNNAKSVLYNNILSSQQQHYDSCALSSLIRVIDNMFNTTPLLHCILHSSLDCENILHLIPNLKELVNIPDEKGRTPLHVACKLSKIKAMQIFLDIDNSDEFINAQTCSGETALHMAFQYLQYNVDAAKLLLQQSNCVSNIKDNHGNIPLHCASRACFKAVKLLKITREDVTTMNRHKQSPIHLAIEGLKSNVVKYLHDYCDSSDVLAMVNENGGELPFVTFLKKINLYSPDLYAKREINEIARYFAEQRLDYDFIDNLCGGEKETFLQLVCHIGFVETQVYLKDQEGRDFITENCSLNSPPYCYINRVTLAQVAAWLGRADIVKYLIRIENVSPNSVNTQGRNLLYYACRYVELSFTEHFVEDPELSSDVIKLLIESGSKFLYCNSESYYTKSLFASICRKEDLHLLKVITSIQMSINVQDRDGNTLLMSVIKDWHGEKQVEASRILIQERACDQTLTNRDGLSALHLVCQSDSLNIMKLLDLSCIDEMPATTSPLKVAIQHGSLKILNYLIENSHVTPDQLLNVYLQSELYNNQKSEECLLNIIHLRDILANPISLPFSAMKSLILNGYELPHNLSLLEDNSPINVSEGDTLLHIACRYNVPELVDKLLAESQHASGHHANVKLSNVNGNTPLHLACQAEAYDCAMILVAFSTKECSVRNSNGDTPLHLACSVRSCECVDALSKDSVCIRNNDGDTPLHIACKFGSLRIIYVLLSDFPQFQEAPSMMNVTGQLPLHYALQELGKQSINFARLHAFLKLMNLTQNISKHEDLMHLACQSDIPQSHVIAQHFKNEGISLELCDADDVGKMPIHHAADKTLKLVQVCASLSTINHQDNEGNTALHIACLNDKFSICEFLVCEMKCDIFIQNKRGQTALHVACNTSSTNYDMCLLLLKTECIIQDKNGNYPLHCLCKCFKDDMLELFMEMIELLKTAEKTESISHPNKCSELPIHRLCKSRAKDAVNAVKALIPYTKDLNAKTISGETPLHLACMHNQHDIIQLLAKQPKCDITITNLEGCTSLHLLCQSKIVSELDEAQKYSFQDLLTRLQEMIKNASPFVLSLKSLLSKDTLFALSRKGKDTPLHLLLKNNYLDYFPYDMEEIDTLYCESLNTLLCFGKGAASIKKCNEALEYPAHVACQYQILPAVKLIGEYRISHERTSEGNTLFHCACQNVYVSIEILQYLKERLGGITFLKEKNKNGDTPLHVYCKTQIYVYSRGLKDCLEFLLPHSDVNSQNSDGNTPFHCMLQNGRMASDPNIFSMFIRDKRFDINLSNKESATVLDLIAKRNYSELAKDIVLFNFYTSKIKELKQLLSCASEKIILELYLFPDIAGILTEIGIDPAPLFRAHKRLCDKQLPLKTPISMLFIGDPMTGKTTLLNSLRERAGEEIVEHESERTAGIVPTNLASEEYGLVTAYDFAGQREYYAGHETVLQSIMKKTPPIILIHVKLATPEGEIRKDDILRGVAYWSNFMKNRLEGTISESIKAPIIIICSHADYLPDETMFMPLRGEIRTLLLTNEQAELSDVILLDCRQPASPGMNHLASLLDTHTGSLRREGFTSFRTHCLHVLINQLSKDKVFVTMNEFFEDQRFFARNFQDFKGICEEMESNGQIMLLKHRIARKRLILLQPKVFLSEITGKLYAQTDEGRLSKTGVITLAEIKSLFPDYDPNMVIPFLSSMEYCFEVQDRIVLDHIFKDVEIPQDYRYFFFPDLIKAERPQNFSHLPCKFCWVLKCQEKNFFSPKFIQLLLLRLVFGCTKKRTSASYVGIRSVSRIWKSGLFWSNGNGIDTLVDVVDTSRVVVCMQCKPKYQLSLLKHRASQIKQIKALQHEICPSLKSDEFVIDSSRIQDYCKANEDILIPMSEICSAVTKEECIVTVNGTLEVEDILLFDPYTQLCRTLVDEIINHKSQPMSDRFIEDISDHLQANCEIFYKLFSISPLRNADARDRFVHILKRWKNVGGNLEELKVIFDSISIFETSDSCDVPCIEKCPYSHGKSEQTDFSTYVSSLPANVQRYLEKQLDWNNECDEDLIAIAHDMLHWEEFCDSLKLTKVDVHDIKEIYPQKPELQRREALTRWKHKMGLSATYGSLLKVFVNVQCAEILCEVLLRKEKL